MTKEEMDNLDPNTKGWYSPLTQTLYIVYETKMLKNNVANLERLRKILLARNVFDLRLLGNMTGADSSKKVEAITPKIMSVGQAIKNNYQIEEIPLTQRDMQIKNTSLPVKNENGFFKKTK